MKPYPSIPHAYQLSEIIHDGDVIIFDKLDGSNIRVEWNKKKGFYKFGTRHHLLDETDPVLGPAISLFANEISDSLGAILEKQKYESAVCFFEYHGPNSFAGMHHPSDVKTLTLLDVSPYKVGIINPSDFIQIFSDLELPNVLYQGLFDKEKASEIFYKVVNGTLPGMGFEGIIGKIDSGRKNIPPKMFKVKSQGWLNLLKRKCGDDVSLFDTLK